MYRFILSAILTAATGDVLAASHKVPAEFVDQRVFVVAKAADGSTLRFYTDSGGGFNAVRADVATRLGLKSRGEMKGDDGDARIVEYPAALLAAGVPKAADSTAFKGGLVVDDSGRLGEDGFLGNRWFDGRVWVFDYRAGTLNWVDRYVEQRADHRVSLHFPAPSAEAPRIAFARVRFAVDGEPLEALLDTGATATLTESSAPTFGRKSGDAVGTSFIIHSRFEAWHKKHADWKVIDAADSVQGHSFRMIEVPTISFGDLEIGPVWFTERPDPAFRNYMAKMMDQPIDGALGGSAFRYLEMVVDYPNAVAYVRKAN